MDIKKLDTFDLIDELQQLHGMRTYVRAHEIERDAEELNHSLLDSAIIKLIRTTNRAHRDFHDAVYERVAVVLKELNRRGVIDVLVGE